MRCVTETATILSTGTHFDENMLTAERNNFLAALSREGKAYGLAVIDLTTGDFKATEMDDPAALQAELERLKPSEIVHPAGDSTLIEAITAIRAVVNEHEGWVFASDSAGYTLRDHFGVQSLDGFGLKNRPAAMGAAGGALHYLMNTLRRDVAHLRQLNFYEDHDFLTLDATTLRNLEILEPLTRDAPNTACLYHAVNQTITPMGARRLRDWLTQPLANI